MEKIARIIHVKSVESINYADQPEIQRQGIDGIITLEKPKIETKTRDYYCHRFHDILLETKSVIENNKLGWFYTTQANIVAYVWKNPSGTNLYDGYLIFITPELREWFDKNKHRFKRWVAHTECNNRQWSTENYAVPIKEFPKNSIKNFEPYLDITEQADLTVFINNGAA